MKYYLPLETIRLRLDRLYYFKEHCINNNIPVKNIRLFHDTEIDNTKGSSLFIELAPDVDPILIQDDEWFPRLGDNIQEVSF